MLDESFYQKADEIIANHTKEEERSLVPIIQDIQASTAIFRQNCPMSPKKSASQTPAPTVLRLL